MVNALSLRHDLRVAPATFMYGQDAIMANGLLKVDWSSAVAIWLLATLPLGITPFYGWTLHMSRLSTMFLSFLLLSKRDVFGYMTLIYKTLS